LGARYCLFEHWMQLVMVASHVWQLSTPGMQGVVGDTVGEVVGPEVVGEGVGVEVVGEVVGVDVVGDAVGEALGVDVAGDAVGEVVGVDVVGDTVGEAVGIDVVGDAVGEVVGVDVVGDAVGEVVGAVDGQVSPTQLVTTVPAPIAAVSTVAHDAETAVPAPLKTSIPAVTPVVPQKSTDASASHS
jgi:hypothetical protein